MRKPNEDWNLPTHERVAHRKHEEERQRQRKARMSLTAAKYRRHMDAIRAAELRELDREQEAKRDLEKHLEELAKEVAYARSVNSPNPWLKPGDQGYVSPEEFALRRQNGLPGYKS